MLDIKGFADSYVNYDILAKRIQWYAIIYPFVELMFGLLYIVDGYNIYLNAVVLIVMSIGSIGVIAAKFKKQKINCACVGTFLKVPLGNIAIIEDLLMVVMSVIMLVRLM